MENETQKLDAVLSKFLREYQKENGVKLVVMSSWESGVIEIQVKEEEE